MKAGWTIKSLGEIAEISAGNSAPQAEHLFNGGTHPFFRTSDVGRVRFGGVHESTDYLNDQGIRGLRQFPKGTILFPKSGASTFLNHRVMLGVDGFVSSHLATIVGDKAEVDQKFLLYFLATISAQDMIQDHAYPSLNLPNIARIRVPVPSLVEQRRIAGTLDEAFDGIATAKANAEKNLQNARALFESHLQAVFTQRGKSWVMKRLEEVTEANCSLSYGVVQPGDEYLDGMPVVRPTDLTTKVVHLSGLKRIDPKLAAAYKRTDLHGGELLLCVRGNTGVVSIASPELVGANVTRGIVPIRFDQSLLTPEFGFYVISSGPLQSQIREKTYGAALMQINIRDLRNITLLFPDLNEQKLITAKLDELNQKTQRLARLYERKIAALDELKTSLLHQAFSGQLTTGKSIQTVSVAIPFPATLPKITTTDLHAGILAMAYQLHEDNNKQESFTHVKAEKIAQMVESRLGIDLGRNPVKDAAGPNDFNHLKKVEHRAKMANFFDFKQVAGGAYRVQKLRAFKRLVDKTYTALGDRRADVERLLQWMLKMTVQQAEIVATVYAAWNNLLLDGKQPTAEQIVFESRENWHPDKRKIEREKFFTAVQWMRDQGVVPEGKGKRVAEKGK